MDDFRLALMCGTDIPIQECALILHQPKLKEIALIGEQDFFQGIQYLCLKKSMFNQDKEVLLRTTNFQIFMTIMTEEETKDKKANVISVLQLLFPEYKVVFTPRSMVFMHSDANITIDEMNFEKLQRIISMIFCLDRQNKEEITYNPGNEQAKIIYDKIMRGRKRVAELKGEEKVSVLSQYISVLTVGLHSMSLDNCINLTVYQLYDLIERYSLYVNWDLDVRSRMAGASSNKPIDNWMKNIHNN